MGENSSTDQNDKSNDQEEEITNYEDLVWLTKKSVRSKLKEWRKDQSSETEPSKVEKKSGIDITCKTCYFCSHVKEFNNVLYARCTIEEPKWIIAEDNLPCWKAGK